MANFVSINALSHNAIASIIANRWFYSASMLEIVKAGMSKCSDENLSKAIKNRQEEVDMLQLLANLLGIKELGNAHSYKEWLAKQRAFTDAQKKHLLGAMQFQDDTADNSSDNDISVDEAVIGARIEQSNLLKALSIINAQAVGEWVKLAKSEYSVPSKSGNVFQLSDGQRMQAVIAYRQWVSIVSKLGLNFDSFFNEAAKIAKIQSWSWTDAAKREDCINRWKVNGLPVMNVQQGCATISQATAASIQKQAQELNNI